MASKTLLDTLKAVTGELGFSQPAVVLSSQVLTDIQLKQLAIASCDELLDAHDWQSLVKMHSFTVTADALYALPADYHRAVDQSTWAGTTEFKGAPSTATWTRLKSGEKRFRVIGDRIEVFEPNLNLGQVITLYYVSKEYVIDGTSGLPKAEFSLDSDKTVFHPRLLTNFVKLKLLQTKNLDTRAVSEDYNASLKSAIGNDTPSPTLCIDGESRFEPTFLGL